MGRLAISPLPFGAYTTLQGGGHHQQWTIGGRIGYNALAVWGVHNASERGTKSAVAHTWADWLYHLCRLGSPILHSEGQNQQGPTHGQIGYIILAAKGAPTH